MSYTLKILLNLATKEIPHGHEVELIQASEAVRRARTRKEKLLAIENLDDLKKARQAMFVRWTIDRHAMKIKALPNHSMRLRKRKDFVHTDDASTKEKMDWESYALHVANYYAERYARAYVGINSDSPSPTKEVLIPNVEQFLVASAPYQEVLMNVRRVYRWENRNKTLIYLEGYLTLWTLDAVLPGILACVIYLILNRRFHPPTIEDLRRGIINVENINETALTLTEFIKKEGDQRWVDPLIEKVGPWFLTRLIDMVNFIEIVQNFYEWRAPDRTGFSVGVLIFGLVAITFTPLWLLARATTFGIGFLFFGIFPIVSHFPEYRLVVSPITWLFYDIPTYAEWAIKELQAEGAQHRESDSSAKSRANSGQRGLKNHAPSQVAYRGNPNTDEKAMSIMHEPERPDLVKEYRSYHCKGGKLILTSVGVRFRSSIRRSNQWDLRYDEVRRLKKITRRVQKSIGKDSGEDLKFTGINNQELLLPNMEKRDEAFSQIVGFASVNWQVFW